MSTSNRRFALLAAVAALFGASPALADPSGPPPIRQSETNRVPACVTPERLMAFIAWRNDAVAPKYAGIAQNYKELGEAARIRWDYAFFQMVLETNYLKFKRGDGSSGDVGGAQNNFAGIGATGGGVPGDRFPDVKTGVLAQMQHLTAYSGEHVERPVAQRTREFQNDIIEISRKLGRPVTFGDLARRWAADRAYAKSIESVADLFRRNHCTQVTAATADERKPAFPQPNRLGASPSGDPEAPATDKAEKHKSASQAAPSSSSLVRTIWRRGDPVPPAPTRVEPRKPAKPDVSQADPSNGLEPEPVPSVPAPVAAVRPAPPTGAARFAMAAKGAVATGAIPEPMRCRVFSASYGGSSALLIRAEVSGETRFTALGVEERSFQSMADSYLASHAQGGAVIGRFGSRDAALHAARELCPAG